MAADKRSYHRKLLTLGAVYGFIGIILSAYAFHGLNGHIPDRQLGIFQTGIRIEIYHAFLALIAGCINVLSKRTRDILFYSLLLGVLFFSGSIYALATNTLTGWDVNPLLFLPPIGGVLLILSWGILIVNFVKIKTF